jgi:hypothetical protein
MTLLTLSTLPFSATGDWSTLSRDRPALSRVFLLLVLPLALLPPGMLYLAGSLHPAMFPPALAHGSWGGLAATFFLTEMATLLAMGWLVQQLARTDRLAVDARAAYLLAGLAPLPLWLASLGLLVPDLLFTVLLAAIALALTCRALYRGILGLSQAREPVTAAWMTQVAIGGALIPWALLVAAVMTR